MGKLIVIEGLDGSGKKTQSKLLADWLREQDRKVREIDFPNYSSDSSLFVRMYLDGVLGNSPDATNAYAASMFFASDRYISYKTDWMKDYADQDTIVIANRYTTANAYHQLAKLPRSEWDDFLFWLWDFEFVRLGLPEPDAVIALSMHPDVSHALIEKRCAQTGEHKDIHESDMEYLNRCYDALQYAAQKMHWIVLTCSDKNGPYPIDVMQKRIRSAVRF